MQVLGILVYVHQRDDVRVVDLAEDLHLALEDLNLSDLRLANRLDGEPILGLSVHTLAHDSVVTMTNLLRINEVLDSDILQGVGNHDSVLGGPRSRLLRRRRRTERSEGRQVHPLGISVTAGRRGGFGCSPTPTTGFGFVMVVVVMVVMPFFAGMLVDAA